MMEDENICKRCGEIVSVPSGMEHTGYCNLCAQDLAPMAGRLARIFLDSAVRDDIYDLILEARKLIKKPE